MLLLTRRFRMLWGFVSGALILISVGTAYGGLRVWTAWMELLQTFSHMAGLQGKFALKLQMYLDFSAVSHMLPGGRTVVGLAIVVALATAVAFILALVLWRSKQGPKAAQWLAWAAALTWTLMLNVYVPIYDSILVVLAVVLTLGGLRELGWSKAAEWITFLAVLIFAASWITEPVARAYHVKILTLLLVLGTTQLIFLRQAIRKSDSRVQQALTR